MSAPYVSIVIPHKNNASLLLRLLESIPQLETIEVLIVDDQSSKKELDLLASIQMPSNAKIIFVDKSGYAGRARNIGLNAASGDWVLFADADDFFSEHFYSYLTPYLTRDDLDIIYFNVSSVNESGGESYRHVPYRDLVLSYLSGRGIGCDIRYRFTPPWGKLFKREFLVDADIKFEEIPASNDIFFSIKAGHLAGQIEVDGNTLYNIVQRTGSITNTISMKNLESKFSAALRVNQFLRAYKKGHYQHSILYFLYRAWTMEKSMSLKMFITSIQAGNNPFIGVGKIVNALEVVRQRESR